MTLTTILVVNALVALLLTLLMKFVIKNVESPVLSYLQNFCGGLFLFSGWVKAVDPLGTAYKMKDYFAEFTSTFEGTWFSFIAPMFPILSEYSVAFAVAMIVFEIILGMMLIMGNAPKLTAWAFFLLVAFFTFLTGFTYLTGYVPGDANFFEFSKWGAFDKNNMKVTDCGCFGDFIKLVPFTSFMKDVFLLIPALLFLIMSKRMHQLFNKPVRAGIVGITTVGLLFYCMSNYVWNIPHADFRPFAKGVNIKTTKDKEAAAMAQVKITDWEMKHNETGEMITVPNSEYMSKDPEKNYNKYKGVYTVTDQVRSEPSIPATKISDFVIEDADGNDLTETILSNPDLNLLVVNYTLKGDTKMKTRMVSDSIFRVDTINQSGTLVTEKTFDRIDTREEEYTDFIGNPDYMKDHQKLKVFTDAAKAKGLNVIMAIGGADEMTIKAFNEDTGLDVTYGMADDILLKTIVRSNPGVVLLKGGVVLNKWHINKLPDFGTISK